MTKTRSFGYLLAFAACTLPMAAIVQAQARPAEQPANKPSASVKNAGQQVHNDGERIFNQNCSRCHNAPEGFSPSISATVVRHMRVRAQLSEHDEQELLRFFNP